MNKMRNKFTWGDAVLIKKDAPNNFRPGEFASICGMNKIAAKNETNETHCDNWEWLYIIEYEDGSSVEVPESYLEKYIPKNLHD